MLDCDVYILWRFLEPLLGSNNYVKEKFQFSFVQPNKWGVGIEAGCTELLNYHMRLLWSTPPLNFLFFYPEE